MLSGLPQHLNLRLDQLAMAAYLRPEVLGLYVAGVGWSTLPTPILTALSQNIFPQLVGVSDPIIRARIISTASRSLILVGSMLGVTLFIFTPIGISLVYGHVGPAATIAAMILVVAAIVSNVNFAFHESFRALGLPKVSMIAETLGLLVTISLLTVLLPRYPLVGAAAASLASYSVVTGYLVIHLRRVTEVRIRQLLVPSAADVQAVASLWPPLGRSRFVARLGSVGKKNLGHH